MDNTRVPILALDLNSHMQVGTAVPEFGNSFTPSVAIMNMGSGISVSGRYALENLRKLIDFALNTEDDKWQK